MKRSTLHVLSLLICTCIIFSLVPPLSAGATEISLSAKSAILIDASDGSVLFEKNSKEQMGMASTTKIMTALVVCELLDLDSKVVIPKEAVNVEGSSVYLCEGEILSVEQLLYALMLSSANDAAAALAIAASGSIAAFAHEMNEKAIKLGLKDTHFVNPHGLYDDMHYTTAYDLALISAEALRHPTLKNIVSCKKATIPQGVTAESPEGSSERYLSNHNKMLGRYDGAIGLKTGFTKKTGRCLVSAAERDGLTLISVTLNAPDDWNDHTSLLDYGFSAYERITVWEKGEFNYPFLLCGGKEDYVLLTNSQSIELTLPKGTYSFEQTVEAHCHFEFAPLKKGTKIAELAVRADGKTTRSPLICVYGAEALHKK